MSWGGDGNQFGGNKSMDGGGFGSPGGFLANTSFDSSAMSQDKQKAKKNLAMMPVTVALLKNATYDAENDICALDGINIYQVTLVGIVTKIQENATHLAYEIDDLTGGIITVKRWIDKQETPEEYQQSQFREDTYVRIYGYVKVLQDGKKTIVAFNVARITDFNEITYHMLSVIHANLALKKIFLRLVPRKDVIKKRKELLLKEDAAKCRKLTDMLRYNRAHDIADMVYNQYPQKTEPKPRLGIPQTAANANNTTTLPGTAGGMQFGNKTSSGPGFGQNLDSTGMTKFQFNVLEVINSATSNEGMSRNEIIRKVAGATDSNIRESVEFLSNEGHIYSTIDDDHFRSTNAWNS